MDHDMFASVGLYNANKNTVICEKYTFNVTAKAKLWKIWMYAMDESGIHTDWSGPKKMKNRFSIRNTSEKLKKFERLEMG